MGDTNKLESIVEQAVGEVLERAIPALRQQIVAQVIAVVAPQLGASAAFTDSSDINAALAAVQSGTTQVQILDALVENTTKFAARMALFVVRGPHAVGWRARGFQDNDAVRNSPVELTFGMPERAVNEHVPVSGPAAEFAQDFGTRFGLPVGKSLVCPLVVRDKVVAIVYSDGGADNQLDIPAIEALVRCTGVWLEVFATRKVTSHDEHAVETHSPRAVAAAASAAAAVAPAPAAVVAEPASAPAPIAQAVASAAVAAPATSLEDEEVHKKARRFAKLLVDEIKLYNLAKVTAGRQNRDLYDRLKEDIEKSRASYDKRYGESAAKNSDYFNQELVRILADNDPALLGGNFPR